MYFDETKQTEPSSSLLLYLCSSLTTGPKVQYNPLWETSLACALSYHENAPYVNLHQKLDVKSTSAIMKINTKWGFPYNYSKTQHMGETLVFLSSAFLFAFNLETERMSLLLKNGDAKLTFLRIQVGRSQIGLKSEAYEKT